MKNEIGRKITSLTLMTIMVAGGLTFAMPSIMPSAYAATENLFVSAENSAFDNSFAGPMVIEVVVNDPDLKETDQEEAPPDVTINGANLVMAQGGDGLWYAYIASRAMAEAADSQVDVARTSLDFGIGCTEASLTGHANINTLDARYGDTVGVFFPFATSDNDAAGSLGECTGNLGGTPAEIVQNVIRESKPLSNHDGSDIGQINLFEGEFPAIQLFDFAVDGKVEVKYNKGGGVQEIELTYLDDADSYASLKLDRDDYPQGASIHATITDLQLNIDPTDEDSWTFGTSDGTTHYQVTDENGDLQGGGVADALPDLDMVDLNFDDNGVLLLDIDTQDRGAVLTLADNGDQAIIPKNGAYGEFALEATDPGDLIAGSGPVTFVETQANSGVFKNTDEGDVANIRVTDEANRGTSATITYNDSDQSILVRNYFGTLTIDQSEVGETWNSGETIPVTLVDEDLNKNSLVDEDLDLYSADTIIPAVRIGSPITLGNVNDLIIDIDNEAEASSGDFDLETFSDRFIFETADSGTIEYLAFNFTLRTTVDQYNDFVNDGNNDPSLFHYVNYDFRSLGHLFDSDTIVNVTATDGILNASLAEIDSADAQGLAYFNNSDTALVGSTDGIILTVEILNPATDNYSSGKYPLILDLFRFGQTGDGVAASDRYNDAIYRMELEETGDNTGTFAGSMEYLMLNQLNVRQNSTYLSGVGSVDDAIELIVHNDLTDEDSVRITYLDEGQDGVETQISAQVAAPTHTGVVTFDSDSYKIADTVTVTLNDPDLNTDVERVDIFTVVQHIDDDERYDDAYDMVGARMYGNTTGDENGVPLGRLLDVTFDDALWGSYRYNHCLDRAITTADDDTGGLAQTGFTLTETDSSSGIFTGNFQVPQFYCERAADNGDAGSIESTTGVDMEVNYLDYRDNSGEITETGDSAGIRANTGTVSTDRSVYPVPWGMVADFGNTATSGDSVFPLHDRAVEGAINEDETLGNGDLMIHVRINDPDYDISASGEDEIDQAAHFEDELRNTGRGPLLVKVTRGSDSVVLATAGAPTAFGTHITIGDETNVNRETRELGPINEIAPDAGIFEADIPIRYSDGPASADCPETGGFMQYTFIDTNEEIPRFWDGRGIDTLDDGSLNPDQLSRVQDNVDRRHCILQGDILTVEYRDPTDASGNPNTVTDSATFDLRNGVLQSDKSVYIIGGDMILTLIEPDFDLDNDEAETYDLDLIEWDSDAADVTMGDRGGSAAAFDPEPSDLRETGDSTGIFQAVIEIPAELQGDRLERGEAIELEYVDWGPAGSNYVGDEDEDVNLTVFTSNFGATIELDQNVYSWTDKVHITIIAPDHNFDSNLVDEIGNTDKDIIQVSTGEGRIDRYKLVETGADTGIFTGEVILTGFRYDVRGDSDFYEPRTNSDDGSGPTDGYLQAEEEDGFSVSFEFSEDETVLGSSLIRWNFGEVQWLQASYPASAPGVVRVIDPDMNLDPESVNNFDIDVTSNSDSAGIDLTVTETNESTGIFEGTVTFTTTDGSSGHRLRVAEGDTVSAQYDDYTLPAPEDRGDKKSITGTTFIGTLVAPLERAEIKEPRILDTSGNTLTSVSVGQQITISADLESGQGKDSPYAYLVQIQDENGVTLALTWDSGTLTGGSLSTKAQSWTPEAPGQYTATIFVWESVGNPIAMSPPAVVPIPVS